MSRRVRQNKTSQQIKEEQINFLLVDVGKNLDEYKKLSKQRINYYLTLKNTTNS